MFRQSPIALTCALAVSANAFVLSSISTRQLKLTTKFQLPSVTSTCKARPLQKLNSYPPIPVDLVDVFPIKEWEQRCALAVSYRIAYLHSWHENIFNHITLKVDSSEECPDGPHFLLNDFGIGFDEITACNLIKVNLDGNVVDQSIPPERRHLNHGNGRVFKPGYVLHSAIHAARDDVHAVWHGHDLDASAISQTKFGMLPLSQEATYVLSKGLSFHPFEGSANDLSEQPRLVANLSTNQMLMLENHGPIVACPTLEEAFHGMYFFTRACKYQVKALSAAGGDLSKINMPDDTTMNNMVKRMEKFDEAPTGNSKKDENPAVIMHDTSGLMFAYARRSAEKTFGLDSIYR